MTVIQPQLRQTKEGDFICLSQLVIVIFDTILVSLFLWVWAPGIGVDRTTLKMTYVIYLFCFNALVCYLCHNRKWFN